MKQTIESKFGNDVKPLARNLTEENYKSKLKTIHTRSVRYSLQTYDNNKVLNARPPEIHKSECILPRTTRSTLAQLRSGYSTHLKSYKARIDPTASDKCPNCDSSHTTDHLFNCQNNPTNLNVRSLWKKPLDAARFLNLATDDEPIVREG